MDDSQSDYNDCVIIDFEDEEDDRNSLNFKNDNIKIQLAADLDGENDNIHCVLIGWWKLLVWPIAFFWALDCS